MSENILKKEERVAFELRSLYRRYGYLPYKMSKFEEYDLYVENKEFLVGDGVITFNDTDGKLLALKPDVTLSIIKNDGDEQGKRKVYYNENVYRLSAKTKQFKEIMQVGLECIGDIRLYDVFETVYLASKSLSAISENFVLDISHLGILSATLAEIGVGEKFNKELMQKLAEKNLHDTRALCEKYGVSEADKEKLLALISAYGKPLEVLKKLAPYCQGNAKNSFEMLTALCELLSQTEYADKIRLDFSVVNDMNYYDDIVFKGFVDGVAEGVLSGGRYDKLMSRMGRKSGAIGFAVYLDLLENFERAERTADVDVLVLYDDTCPLELLKKVNELTAEGKTVRVQNGKDGIRYGTLLDLTGGKV